MQLYLLRHAEAEPQITDDASRALTAIGRREVASVARSFIANQLPIDRCFCSPYLRATQTASAFLQTVKPQLAYQEAAILTPEIRASEVMKLLDSIDEEHVLLVSHNPLLSELGALLMDGNISNMHILGTGELLVLQIDVVGLGMAKCTLQLVPDIAFQPS